MVQERSPAIVLFGSPGVGKGTVGRVLNQIPGFRHVSSGDVFRSLDPNTAEGKEVAERTSRGELVSDELTIRIFRNVVSDWIRDGKYKPTEEALVMDGVPRTVQQAKDLAETVDVLAVVYFVCRNEDVMLQRMKRRATMEGRPDDADEATIRHRFEVYRRKTEPVLRSYPSELVHEIDADPTPAEVVRDVLNVLIPVVGAYWEEGERV